MILKKIKIRLATKKQLFLAIKINITKSNKLYLKKMIRIKII